MMLGGKWEADAPKTPDNKWRRDMALIVSTFPELIAFELDNERGDPMSDEYGEYHRVFAEIIKACRPDAWSVEEGCGGSLGVLVFNTRTMHDCGFFYGVGRKDGVHYRSFGAYARPCGTFNIKKYLHLKP